MSSANVEIIERFVEAFYARDTQAAVAILDRDMMFESALVQGKTYRALANSRSSDATWMRRGRSGGPKMTASSPSRKVYLDQTEARRAAGLAAEGDA